MNLRISTAVLMALICGPASGGGWPADKVGAQQIWDAASQPGAASRFIPMQLIVPGIWDGAARIDMPTANGYNGEETQWRGPAAWTNPYTGQLMTVYDRSRTTRREGYVAQKMAVRSDGSALGRVYDSRFGEQVCEQEAKFPLGLWHQGEVRTFDYLCLSTRDGHLQQRPRRSTITIEELDYEYGGVSHCLRFDWLHVDRDTGEMLDRRSYILSPGRGLIVHDRH